MGMRTVYLKPKIYGHRLKTLAEENGIRDEAVLGAYERLKEAEPAAYYEYNFPVRSYMTVILSPGETPVLETDGNAAEDEVRAEQVICKELFKETMRLLNDWVSRENRSSIGVIEYIDTDNEKGEEFFRELCQRWEKLPSDLPGTEKLPFETRIFTAKLGLRLGCSGGGSCASCQHPTCGYRS